MLMPRGRRGIDRSRWKPTRATPPSGNRTTVGVFAGVVMVQTHRMAAPDPVIAIAVAIQILWTGWAPDEALVRRPHGPRHPDEDRAVITGILDEVRRQEATITRCAHAWQARRAT